MFYVYSSGDPRGRHVLYLWLFYVSFVLNEGELLGVTMLAIPLAEFHVFAIMDVSKWIYKFVCKRKVLNQL
jgi:hypothetical protein